VNDVRSEREKMLAGDLYRADDPELVRERLRARELTARYNASPPGDDGGRGSLLGELLAAVGEGASIEPPFHCDYGWNISLGARAFLNFDCVALDCAPVVIGDGCLIGPAVQFCAATHTPDPAMRADGLELAGPITLGSNVWVGAGVIFGAGVTVGDNSVIGAGSVVLDDVPENVLAAGSPCRVIRAL
jgi:maltose O-acetyltransferase